MIRLTWRQFRFAAALAGAAILVVAAVALVTGPALAHAYAQTLQRCRVAGDCPTALAAFAGSGRGLGTAFTTLTMVLPLLVGVFWGAPLVARELESGTLPLVWTQSVTRTRWLLVKVGLLALATVVVTAAVSLVVTWWSHPLDLAAATRYDTFGERDVAPVGYALFAFALGVTIGILVRRTVAAMALTLFVFAVVRITTTYGLRPRLFTPQYRVLALDPHSTGLGSAVSPTIMLNSWFNGGPTSALDPSVPTMPDAWIYSSRVVDARGHDLTDAVLNATCPGIGPDGGGGATPGAPGHVPVPDEARHALETCVSTVGSTYHQLVTYQPASRYWPLQWTELGLYTAAALAVATAGVWWVRRRL